ncbi:MAG: ATP-binding protein [Brevundimonas sp.]|jgi:two-component system, OmpR family, sensor histidine kinase ChvG|uniref:ATP-binding protein n=1 Tax=Brevundimonas sp. TaxID=1871086 RepID=UPI00391DCF7B
MASDTVTGKAEGPTLPSRRRLRARHTLSRWRFPGSRLGGLILFLNLLSLMILFVGALALNEWRRGLVDARLDSLEAQAELLSNLLGETQVTRGEPFPAFDALGAALLLRDNFVPQGQRARLFDIDGLLVADSYNVTEIIAGEPLPPARPSGSAERSRINPEQEQARLERARIALGNEVDAALDGETQRGLRLSESGDQVVSVSIPIRHVQSVLGVLTLEAGDVEEILSAQRRALTPFAIVAFGVSLLTSFLLHLFIARPVLRLASAADQVRLERARAISLPDLERREDEIGDLARSLETMTATLSNRMDAIERFAADVAHEIKNPLTSIRSAIETLELVKDDSAKARMIAVLQQDVRRLDRLITDISNASRLDAELSRDAPRPIDLTRLLGDIIATYDPAVGAENVSVSLTAPDEPVEVVSREGPLGQVFRNLIDNARSFSPPGGEVRVCLDEGDDPLRPIRIIIEDDGPGIPPENLETVFERFYTSRPRGTAFGNNSGLGLSIARQIVTSNDGLIHAENRMSADGTVAGARFVVELPHARV